MIKWFYPKVRYVPYHLRVKYAGDIASKVPSIDFSMRDQDNRMQDPRMYTYHLLLWERSEHDIALRKIKQLQDKLITVSKELSSLKKNKK